MKKAIALLLALVTLLSLTACAGKEDTASSALDQIKQKGELVVGTSADYPPYEFHTEVDGKDTIVGFDMEIAQAIADKLGVSSSISSILSSYRRRNWLLSDLMGFSLTLNSSSQYLLCRYCSSISW